MAWNMTRNIFGREGWNVGFGGCPKLNGVEWCDPSGETGGGGGVWSGGGACLAAPNFAGPRLL
jgi:hypothetical protein